MNPLLIMIIIIVATPQNQRPSHRSLGEVGPQAQPMKSCIEMLREQPYLTGVDKSDKD